MDWSVIVPLISILVTAAVALFVPVLNKKLNTIEHLANSTLTATKAELAAVREEVGKSKVEVSALREMIASLRGAVLPAEPINPTLPVPEGVKVLEVKTEKAPKT